MDTSKIRLYERLSQQYPNIASVTTEIINLQAILQLPKGTEHFITDVHGEYLQFRHIIRNGSGTIRRKINETFGERLTADEKKELAALIYYPEEKIAEVKTREEHIDLWYEKNIRYLILVSRSVASKYTRSKVRKAMPKDLAYIMEELTTGRDDISDQHEYNQAVITTIIMTGRAEELIIAFANLIRRLVVDHLHVIGDIFDRGPQPHLIMDDLMAHHSVDIQWGNHDALWMGAALGDEACICNAIRIAARYGNLSTLEEGYGINLLPLAKLAMEYYNDDPCERFEIKDVYYEGNENNSLILDNRLEEMMHKAITILQFKAEGSKILRHPEFKMEDRLLLDKMDLENGTICVDGKQYQLKDVRFPTLDFNHPYAFNEQETEVMEQLKYSFVHNEKLQRHIEFLVTHGGLYKVYNGNLLYHGCVPLNPDGEFAEVELYGKKYSGKKLYDFLDTEIKNGFASDKDQDRRHARDLLWWLWENPASPVFGKDKMSTFERYFISVPEIQVEEKNAYYRLVNDEETVERILNEFGLFGNEAHIINGHIPVQAKSGESPVKCNGKVFVIDGGLSKAYQSKTGIAGYTLLYNSYGLIIAAHEPFESVEAAVKTGADIHSDQVLVQKTSQRKRVIDTDNGQKIMENIQDLQGLLDAYKSGIIAER